MKVEGFKTQLLEQLKDSDFIKADVYERLNKEDGFKSIDDLIIRERLVDEEEYTKVKAKIFNLPYMDLTSLKVPSEILKIIPKDIAENYQVIAFLKRDKQIHVGVIDPMNFKAQEAVKFLVSQSGDFSPEFYLVSPTSYKKVFDQFSALGVEVKEALSIAKGKFEYKTKNEEAAEVEEVIKSAPVSKMVSVILKHAVDGRASDIHIEPGENSSRIRYRIDGVLQTSLVLPKYIHSAVVSRIKVLANLKIDETRLPQDGRIRISVSNRNIDFRISTFPLNQNEKVVMRILDTSKGVIDLNDLGFVGKNYDLIKENINKPHGILLVTGPTGSGKSTTLYSVLNILNKDSVNIVTLEDPIEYYISGVNQSQVNPDIGYTFASGLRSILRQDPNVIMVGEIRDNETAELAIHAGLTGHVVLSTLHTNDAFGAVPRLIDMQVEPFLITSTVNIIVAQRLVRKLCKYCKTEDNLPETLKKDLEKVLAGIPKESLPEDLRNLKEIKTFIGKGCPKCGNTGYSGRLAIAEVLAVNEEIKKVIYEARWEDLKTVFKKQGLLTLLEDGVIKALQGITSMEEVSRVTKE